jgi:DNA invertase Pin-like site-specific DNA recombinase
MSDKQIKHVAIYLRKSRDEGEFEDVLSKHRDTLVPYAEKQGWTYTIYEEIGSGESLSRRKKIQVLLNHVEDKRYDGVLVMDIDRLGRGNITDWAQICEAFIKSYTYVITPQRIYDLTEGQDEFMFGIMTNFSKMEYTMIKKRLKQGKVAGAKKGMWTNGTAPYPYVYNPVTRTLDIDPEKYRVYRMIIEKYLGGNSILQIAVWLTQQGIPTLYGLDRNKHGWSTKTVHRILINEIHLGYVIYGRTETYRGSARLVPEQDWIKVKGSHEPVKTEEEHQLIMAKLAQNTLIPKKNRSNNVLPLTGILYCAKCGRRMQFKRRVEKGETFWTAVCVYIDPHGKKCSQVGRKMDNEFYNVLNAHVTKITEQTITLIRNVNSERREALDMLSLKNKELVKVVEAMERLFDLYEDGTISKQKLTERMDTHEKSKQRIQSEIERYRVIVANTVNELTIETFRERIDEFKQLWLEAATTKEKNKAYRLLIDRIVYNRSDDSTITLEVSYR